MGTRGVRYRRDRGIWFIDYIAADGRRMRETIGPGEENRRLACTILAQREAEATLGQHHVRSLDTPRFGTYADEWLELQRPRLRPASRTNYELMIRRHLNPAFGEKRLGAIARHDVETYLVIAAATMTARVEDPALAPHG
jgi:hypothetical protein